MSDRISLMLDNMVTAVDDGFSYDGIVSVPETGLEDAGQRPGLAGWVDSGHAIQSLIQATIRIMWAAAGVNRKPKPTMDVDQKSSVDSGIGPDDNEKPSPTGLQELGSGTGVQIQPHTGGRERLPRKIRKWATKSPPSDTQRLPRKKNNVHEEDTSMEKRQVQSRPGNQEGHPPSDGQELPLKKSESLLEDIRPEDEAVHPDVDQGLMGKEKESQPGAQGKLPRKIKVELNHPSNTDQKERQPRLAKQAEDVEGSGGPSGDDN